MKTTNEVIDAVRDGIPVDVIEMQCAIMQLAYYVNSQRFDIARAITESKDGGKLEPKTIRGLGYIWKRLTEDHDKDLNTYIMGTSMEPGLAKNERCKRSSTSVFRTVEKLQDILTKK